MPDAGGKNNRNSKEDNVPLDASKAEDRTAVPLDQNTQSDSVAADNNKSSTGDGDSLKTSMGMMDPLKSL